MRVPPLLLEMLRCLSRPHDVASECHALRKERENYRALTDVVEGTSTASTSNKYISSVVCDKI